VENFGGRKLWQIASYIAFGEENFGEFIANHQIRQSFPPTKIFRYTVYIFNCSKI